MTNYTTITINLGLHNIICTTLTKDWYKMEMESVILTVMMDATMQSTGILN